MTFPLSSQEIAEARLLRAAQSLKDLGTYADHMSEECAGFSVSLRDGHAIQASWMEHFAAELRATTQQALDDLSQAATACHSADGDAQRQKEGSR